MAKTIRSKTTRRFRACASGVAAIEMALVLPVMLFAYFGLVDLANGISASRRVTTAASTMADLVTQASSPTTTRAELLGFFEAAASIIEPFNTSGLAVEIYGFRQTNNVVTQIWRQTNGVACPSGAPPIDLERVRQLGNDTTDVIVARVCYTVAPIVGYVVKANINLSEQMALRPRYTSRIACSDC
jgi:Flp pilus assembly protein TadG